MTSRLPDDTRTLLGSALDRIKTLTSERDALRDAVGEPVAIVGMGARMPGGADDTAAYWELLADGRDAVVPYPPERLGDVPGGFPAGVPSGGFLDSVDRFDAGFFGISAREAGYLDPQQRLLLETSWEALENAGAKPASLRGSRLGVYLGVTNNDYMESLLTHVAPQDLEAYALTGMASTFAAGRIAYWLGTHGPSLSVDTACSSSLVAVHLAAQALRSRDADLAVAGGVNVLLSPEWYTVLDKAGMLSPHARCATFDASADGYVRSEGCGVVVLKRLSDARADGDRVLAVVRGTAVNQDGRAGGITVPNARAQRDVVSSALAAAGLTAEDIDYVEAHGTGTPVGDPIELHALADVLCPRSRTDPLLVGSVKTNLGHLEPAAGVAGLIKVLLSLNHDFIPPHRGLSNVNDDIDLEALNVEIPVEGRAWRRGDRVRRAGVSSFGASGTNAHVILEEASDGAPADGPRRSPETYVLPLSARTAEGVADLAGRYLARLGGADGTVSDGTAADLAYTAGVARDHWPVRRAVSAPTVAGLRGALRRVADGEAGGVAASTRRRRRVAFLFTGQGSQYTGMGGGLLESSPAFRTAMEHCAGLVDPLLDRPLLEVVAASDDTVLNDTRYTQPALVALEWSLAQMWRSLGVEPDVVVGHSVGEIAAAAVAGVLDVADALAVAVARGRLMQELTGPGAMAAVFAPADAVRDLLAGEDEVGTAAVNGPEHVVISGRPDRVRGVLDRATERGLRSKSLTAERAFHSPLMQPMLDAFAGELSQVAFRAPSVPLVSSLTAEYVGPDEWNAAYLLEHALRPVDFAGAMTAVAAEADDFLELGPAPTLLVMARRFVPEEQRSGLWAPSLRPGRRDAEVVSATVAEAYTSGLDLDWEALWAGSAATVTDAPTYPFRRTRHWYEPSRREAVTAPHRPAARLPRQGAGALIGRRVPTAGPGAAFLATLDGSQDPALADCVIGGEPIVNVGFFLEAALQAAGRTGPGDTVRLEDVTVLQRLPYDAERPPTVMLVSEPTRRGTQTFSYRSEPEDAELSWPEHCRGRIVADGAAAPQAPPESPEPLPQAMSGADFYRHMWSRRLYLGDGAKWIEEVSFDADHARARLRVPGAEEAGRYLVPPGLVDAMFQALFACLTARGASDSAYMVVALESFTVRTGLPTGPSEVRLRLRAGSADAHTLVADVFLLDESGTCRVSATGVTLARAQADAEVSRPRAEAWSPVEASLPAERPAEAGGARDPVRTVVEACARSLRADPGALPRDEPVQELGLDSLMALEIKDTVMDRCGVAVPLAMFLDGATVGELAAYVAERLPAGPGGPETVPGGAGAPERTAHEHRAVPAAPLTAETGTEPVADPDGRYEPFELTDLQQAYLVGRTEGIELGGVSTFFFIDVDLSGLDCERFESAVDAAVGRHDMLRAVMTDDGRQRVLPRVEPYRLDRLDLTREPAERLAERLAERSAQLSGQVLDPQRWPLFHLAVTFLPDGVTRLHVGIDALVIDAWSTALLFAELTKEYRGARLHRPELTFRDYVRHIRSLESGPRYAEAKTYWTDRIAALPPAPELPLSADPAAIGRPEFAHLSATIDPQRWERFKDHAQQAGITPSAAIAAAYAETIALWSANPHFTLTLLFFNRSPVHPDVGSVLGNFSATTLLEVDTRGNADFAARGRRLQRQLWSDLEHSAFSGVQVLRELATLHGTARAGRAPVVFASTLNFSSGEGPASTALTDHLVALTGEGREVSSSIRTPQVWLDHQVIEDADGLRLNWDYVSQLFPESMITSMFATYRGLIDSLCDDEEAWAREPDLRLPESELEPRRLANATAADKPTGLLHHGFEKAAAQFPDAVAVVCGDEELTYAELDARSEALARRIAGRTGPDAGELVAVMLPKGPEQVVAVLAVLKAGKAYVPIAADLPAERARTTLELSTAVLTLADPAVRSAHPWLHGHPVLDVSEADDGDAVGAADGVAAEPGDLAYVIFTSGSTGRPKGVVIEHRAALTTLKDVLRRFGIGPGDRVLGLSALNFDLSVFDVFGILAAGGTLVLPRPDQLRDPEAWAESVRRHGVTVWNSVPALLQMLVDHLEGAEGTVDSLRTVMLSGDWIPTDLPDRASRCAPGAAVHSLGGATEAAIWSITYPISTVDPAWSSIPYGRPLENQGFHVLDDRWRHRPVGVPGDLYIAGDGLARGYLGDPEKTAASFLDTPHGRLYRTGDLGRYLPDGDIEFLGRQDGQVKVHGYRIELGEIESALSRVDGVRGAVAAALGDAMESRTLVAGVVRDSTEQPLEPVREALREQLPAYMVPSRIVDLDGIPITTNGKVDRKALAKHCRPSAARRKQAEPLRDDTERAVAELWSRLLPEAPAGRDDDFFALGGNSLLGVRLMSLLRARWGTALPLSVLFTHSTVAAMSEAVREGRAERTALVPMTHDGAGPRSYWIHPVGGDVVCYRGVAGVLDTPVTGIQVPDGLRGPVSVGGLADLYAEAVAADCTGREVRIAGWSMGGVLALEVAERLASRGFDVAPVIAVDLMEHPDTPREEPAHAELLTWFARDVAHIAGVPDPLADADLRGADDPDALAAERLRSSGLLGSDTDGETIDGLLSRFAGNARALATHRPGTYTVPAVLVQAEHGATESVTAAWAQHCSGPVTVHVLDGDHYSVLQGDRLADFGSTVRSVWSTSEGRAATPSPGDMVEERN